MATPPSTAAVTPPVGAARGATLGVCALLVAGVLAVFGQTWRHEFVNFDDDTYIVANSYVRRGLTAEGLLWAFHGPHASNWHPLTSLSHLLDCQCYGLNPALPHLENVALHAATAGLLFLFLLRATGAFWPSAFTAAVFAVHPLRAESVAWLAERKDVLSGLFFVLTLHAYLRFARGTFSLWRYALVLIAFALGLMCKPMLVTLPLVLLLLDYWPLGRFGAAVCEPAYSGRPTRLGRLIVEKVPLGMLAAASCVVTLVVQSQTVAANKHVPLLIRLSVVVVSYVEYLGQFFCPLRLGVLYPFPEHPLPLAQVGGVLLLLLIITTTALAVRRTWPFLLTGWLWYLAMLVPVIGIVKVGAHSMADRYTYLPQIGFAVALIWTLARCSSAWRIPRCVLGPLAAAGIVLLAVLAARQTACWNNSETLWTRTLECAPQNVIAHNNLGIICALQGRTAEAIAHWDQALVIDPSSARAHTNLGIMLAREGRFDEAIARYRAALRLESTLVQAHSHLARALTAQGAGGEALTHARRAVELQPADAGNHLVLAQILCAMGEFKPAIACLHETLRLNPDEIAARGILAWLWATCPDGAVRNGPQAVALAEEVLQRGGATAPEAFDTLAAAYAEVGRFPAAVAAAQRAIELARARSSSAVAEMLARQELYRTGRPFHTDWPTPRR